MSLYLLIALAGPWTAPAGTLKVGVGGIHWQAEERFVGAGAQNQLPSGELPDPGDVVELGTDTDGARLTHQQVALDLTLGVTDALQVRAWVPFVRARFEDDANEDGFETTGTGDPIFGVDYRVLDPLALGLDLKVPVSEVPRTSTDLPISEGQIDVTFWERSGLAFAAGWVQLDLGYRVRLAFEEDLPPEEGGRRAYKPGNEFVWLLGGGLRPGLDWMAIMLDLDGLHGADRENRDNAEGLVFQEPRRELIELRGGLLFDLPWALALTTQVGYPIYGRHYPAGPRFMARVGRAFHLW